MKKTTDNPSEFVDPPVPGRILWCMAALLSVQCAVQAWLLHQYPSPLNSFLFRHDWSEPVLNVLDQVMLWSLLISTLGIFYRRWIRLMIPMALVFLLLAVFKMMNSQGGAVYDRFAVSAQAIRMVLPVAFLLMHSTRTRWQHAGFQWIRVGVALTFVTHGAECFGAHPTFLDLIIGSGYRLLNVGISEAHARIALYVIGAMDLVTAILLLSRRWRAVALWMAIWGGIAACSRMTGGGVEMNWPKSLLRVANAGGPLILYLWWHFQLKQNARPDQSPE